MVKNQKYVSPLVRTLDFPVEAAAALSQATQKNRLYEISNGGEDNEFA
ncbi:MAG: hypothetical protein PUI52_03740 [Bacteroidales bacterium]|nr:hypothetical protein [Bacteroidales bacterium]MDY6170259.1 hypothetical protein [Candidatus Cryptobacteroides sp.]